MHKLHYVGFAVLCGLLGNQRANAQACSGNTTVVGGSYVFAAIAGSVPGATTPNSNSGGTPVYSNTELGLLMSGVSGLKAFSVTGALSFNGAGQVYASPSAQSGTSALAGSYTVNLDCTMGLVLTDPAGSNAPVTKLSGIILSGGNEVDLFSAPPPTVGAGTANPPSAAGGIASQGGLIIRLIRPFFNNYGCTTGNLSGPYALVLNGLTTTTTATGTGGVATQAQPLTLVARALFDGLGTIVADPTAVGSPLAAMQVGGTYVVNADCSGTMILNNGSSSVSAAGVASPTTTVNFALTAPVIVLSLGVTALSRYSTKPSIVLSVSNPTQMAIGSGTAQ